MAERIYVMTTNKIIEPLEETAFDKEATLQELIAEHPELLDGEQMRPGDPRRWLLIGREIGVPAAAGEGARWALDHLLVDQDATLTLVEVKRGWSADIRRTVIGQVLEYAAHASETWTADKLRETFERGAVLRRSDPQEALATLLQSGADPDADAFWDNVATNLAANRLRLLIISERIPDELARVVTFLNKQMVDIEVLAVEIKSFKGNANQTLVPRVIGRTTEGAKAKRGGTGTRVTRESFLEGFADERVRAVAEGLLATAQAAGAEIAYGRVGISIRVRCEGIRQPITVAWAYPNEDVRWMQTREFSFGAALYDHKLPDDKLSRLETCLTELRNAEFTEPASNGGGVQAWAVSHERAAQHQDELTRLLKDIIAALTS